MRSVVRITAGTGPVEVRQFVGLLAEHLAGECRRAGATVHEVVEHRMSDKDVAPASVEVWLSVPPGESGAAVVAGLSGTHALLARSALRGKKARKRWYAAVEIGEGERGSVGEAPRLSLQDLVIVAQKGGGPGGQKVNKTSSTVRVTHPQSGISVRVSEERSQRENVRVGVERIARILLERDCARARGAKASARMGHYRVRRGQADFVYELDREGRLLPCAGTCSR
ncbi:MAG: peptide chain release factor-like protein [Polyangiaceae bacterium]